MLGDDLAAALPELRAQAESLMRTTVTVTRVTGTAIAGDREVPTATAVYQGKARIVRASVAAAQVDAAGRPVTVQRPQINFPAGAFAMQVGDLVAVTANPDDPSLIGHRYRLTAEAPAGSTPVRYRIAAEEVV